MKRIFAYALLATTLCGCGTYSVYHRPVGLQTDGLYGTEVNLADTGSIAFMESVVYRPETASVD